MRYQVYAEMRGRSVLLWQTNDLEEARRFARSLHGYVVSGSGVRVFG
jgi:hypothetical protein